MITKVQCKGAETAKQKKKDVRDFTDRDFDRLLKEWDENDEEGDSDEDESLYRKPQKQESLEDALKNAQSPEDLMKMSKKGQTVMMFVGLGDVIDGRQVDKQTTERWCGIWQSSLFNNHIDVQLYVLSENRALFLFTDGSKAWEAKDFFLKQPQVKEVSLEGRQFEGPAAARQPSPKEDL